MLSLGRAGVFLFQALKIPPGQKFRKRFRDYLRLLTVIQPAHRIGYPLQAPAPRGLLLDLRWDQSVLGSDYVAEMA
jgi:hypothetical protein